MYRILIFIFLVAAFGGAQSNPNWMQKLNESSKQKPLSRLLLPATHDSSSYQIDLASSIPMERTTQLNVFLSPDMQGELALYLLNSMTLTQTRSITEQLLQGIRGFDFRFFFNSHLQKFFLSHSFATIDLESALYEIKYFLLQFPQEILLIQMSTDKEHQVVTEIHNDDAAEMVQSILGEFLIPVSENGQLNNTMTVQSLQDSGQRVLFSFLNPLEQNHSHVWPAHITQEYWPNQATPEASKEVIESYIGNMSQVSSEEFNLIFFTTTPDITSIVENLIVSFIDCSVPDFGNNPDQCPCSIKKSLLDHAAILNDWTLAFLRNNSLPGLNLVSVDNPSNDFVSQVILRNAITESNVSQNR